MAIDAALESEYSPSSCIGGNYQPFVRAYTVESQKARTATVRSGATWTRLVYGTSATQFVDLCVPSRTSNELVPLLVFIHGGYWQELSSDDSLFASLNCISQGAAFAAINYTLAPDAALSEIVEECAAALCAIQAHCSSLGVDASRIVVAGSSAGAHLAAMTATVIPLRGVVLVSGVYWLEPLVATSINGALGLTPSTARDHSPGLGTVNGFPPAIVCWGEIETASFKQQSRDFAGLMDTNGVAVQMFEVPGRNHFDVIMDLAKPDTDLGNGVRSLLFAGSSSADLQ
jgi:arylformamidase